MRKWVRMMIFLSLGNFFYGCQEKNYPDTSGIDIDLDIQRVDQELLEKDPVQLRAVLSQLEQRDSSFYKLYIQRILPIGNLGKEINQDLVIDYLLNADIQQLSDTIQSVFPNDEYMTSKLVPVFQNFHHYFPQEPIPKLYTFHSAFNYGVVALDDDAMGVGLDFFLGGDFEAYHPSLFPDYIRRTMSREYLAPRVAKVLIKNLIPPLENFRLLDRMIYEGKMLYGMQLLLPEYPDSLVFHYETSKIDWLKTNEVPTWAMILKQEWLYSQNSSEWNKLIQPSPSGPSNMPVESPGEAGSWIGAKIVKEFVRRNPDIPLEDVLKITDSQKIMDLSKYKPR